MGFLDTFRVSREQKEEEKKPVLPPQGHTLAEILQDKKKSDLFGKLLNQSGDIALARKIADGKLEESDVAVLEEKRIILSEKIVQAEKVEKFLTAENVVAFARRNPEFQTIINQLGPEKAIRAIKNCLADIAITDESRFENIVNALEESDKYLNGNYKKINEKIEKLLEEKEITPEEYQEVLNIADPAKKAEAMKQLSYKTNTGFKRAINFLSFRKFGKDDTLKELLKAEKTTEKAMKQLDAYQRDIGAQLFLSVSQNDDMKKSFFGELLNERAPEKPEFGFRDGKKEVSDQTSIDQAWEKKKKKKNFAAQSTGDQEATRHEFIAEQKQAYKDRNAGKGFWATIFEALFNRKLDDNKDKLK